MKTYIAIDNGVSGSIAVLSDNLQVFLNTKVKKELSYTKTKQYINRIDFEWLLNILVFHKRQSEINETGALVLMERPMVNPMRFKASVSGLRAFESTLIAVEIAELPFQYEDSKKWQKAMLPAGLKGDELKKASLEVGNRLFPVFSKEKHKDRDSLLMAEYARRNNL